MALMVLTAAFALAAVLGVLPLVAPVVLTLLAVGLVLMSLAPAPLPVSLTELNDPPSPAPK